MRIQSLRLSVLLVESHTRRHILKSSNKHKKAYDRLYHIVNGRHYGCYYALYGGSYAHHYGARVFWPDPDEFVIGIQYGKYN